MKHSSGTLYRKFLWNQGFTLLEVMVTLSILAIALLSLFDLHSQTLSMTMDSRFNASAPYLAQRKMAELDMTPVSEITPGSGDFGDDFPAFTWKLETEDVQPETLKDTRLFLKKMDLAIGLDGETSVYTLRAYRLIQE